MGGRPHHAAADPVHHYRRRPPGAAAGERSHVCARRRAQEVRDAEGLRPLRGLWRRRLPRGDGGDAGVVWNAPTGAVTASFRLGHGTRLLAPLCVASFLKGDTVTKPTSRRTASTRGR